MDVQDLLQAQDIVVSTSDNDDMERCKRYSLLGTVLDSSINLARHKLRNIYYYAALSKIYSIKYCQDTAPT